MQAFKSSLAKTRTYLNSRAIVSKLCKYGFGTILIFVAVLGSQAFRTTQTIAPAMTATADAVPDVSRHSTLNAEVFQRYVGAASQRMYPRLSREIVDSATRYSEKYDLSPILVLAIIETESEFYPFALSKQNAKGLMQINPDANENALIKKGIFKESSDIFDPERSIEAGCFLLREFINESPDFNTALDKYLGANSVKYKVQIHEVMGRILLFGITEELNRTAQHRIDPLVKVEPHPTKVGGSRAAVESPSR
jgi:soluble lytic murein transglycosylase-like protein